MVKRNINLTINIRGTADEKTIRDIEKMAFDFIKSDPKDPLKLKKRIQL